MIGEHAKDMKQMLMSMPQQQFAQFARRAAHVAANEQPRQLLRQRAAAAPAGRLRWDFFSLLGGRRVLAVVAFLARRAWLAAGFPAICRAMPAWLRAGCRCSWTRPGFRPVSKRFSR